MASRFAVELPQPIRNGRDFDRMVAQLEELDFAKRKLTREENALRDILAALIQVCDDLHCSIPKIPPHETGEISDGTARTEAGGSRPIARLARSSLGYGQR